MNIIIHVCIMLVVAIGGTSLSACQANQETIPSAKSSQTNPQKKIFLSVDYDSPQQHKAVQREIQRVLESRGVNFQWADWATLRLPQGSYKYLEAINGVKRVSENKPPY